MRKVEPFSEKEIDRAMTLIVDFHRNATPNHYITAEYLSSNGAAEKGKEMPIINFLCSKQYISYEIGGYGENRRINLLSAGWSYFEDKAAEKEKRRIERRRFRIPVAISIVALVVSIVSLIRTW